MKKITPIRTGSAGILIRFTVDGKRYSFAPIINGRFDEPADYGQSWAIAQKISRDIAAESFDETLEKYKPKPKAEVERIEQRKIVNLLEIWESYIESKKKQVQETTFKNSYPKYNRVLQLCPYKSISDGLKIKRWIIENKPAYFAKKILQQYNACCEWAIRNDLIASNPFKNYAHEINNKAAKVQTDINPFSAEERDEIIKLFKSDIKLYYWSGLVQFMFATGCRPSEALALEWSDCGNGMINFNKAYTNGILKNTLKTQEYRQIAQNEKVKNILTEQIKLISISKINKHDLVFIGQRKNSYLNFANFTRSVWPKALKQLTHIRYRPPYQMRHTFITLALQQGVSAQDIARHCGNSADVIYRHYAGSTRNFVMPEI